MIFQCNRKNVVHDGNMHCGKQMYIVVQKYRKYQWMVILILCVLEFEDLSDERPIVIKQQEVMRQAEQTLR
jgi:hypothetical protein